MRALLVVVGLTALALAIGEVPAAEATVPSRVSLVGGPASVATICGARRRVVEASTGSRPRARVGVRRARRRGRKVTVAVERCSGGRWRTVRHLRGRRARGTQRRFQVRLPALGAGDYRLTSRVTAAHRRGRGHARRRVGRRHRARSRHAYLRLSDPVVDVPVRFRVRNVNRSAVPCGSDGAEYTIAGRLVAPRAGLRGAAPAVTLYLHEFSWGRFFWNFPAQDYDYATKLAQSGHASLVIDRLGYDDSSRPAGTATCQGAQADISSQIVAQLRAGSYRAGGAAPVAFRRVGLAGHSVGGGIAELQAYSFGSVDALVLFAYADQGFTSAATIAAAQQGLRCGAGGEPSDPGGPPGYEYFSSTPDAFKAFAFHSAEPAVADRATAMRNRDPCGDVESTVAVIATNTQRLGEVKVPVLLLYGTSDAIYDQPSAGEAQRRMFTASQDVSLNFFPDSGHALTLERTAPQVRQTVADWLSKRGL